MCQLTKSHHTIVKSTFEPQDLSYQHTILLHIISSNPTTPKSVNKTRFKKAPPTPRSTGSTWVKRQYSSTHKTMAETIEKGNRLLIEFIHKIHANTMVT
jgi:hypothetical protein